MTPEERANDAMYQPPLKPGYSLPSREARALHEAITAHIRAAVKQAVEERDREWREQLAYVTDTIKDTDGPYDCRVLCNMEAEQRLRALKP